MMGGLRQEPSGLSVLSNREGFHGAAAILYPGELKRAADQLQNDLVVLPSSIHEVLLLPDDPGQDYGMLTRLVQEINRNEVEQEEWLSDHPYRYLRKEDRLVAV